MSLFLLMFAHTYGTPEELEDKIICAFESVDTALMTATDLIMDVITDQEMLEDDPEDRNIPERDEVFNKLEKTGIYRHPSSDQIWQIKEIPFCRDEQMRNWVFKRHPAYRPPAARPTKLFAGAAASRKKR
jgi:hypothetical protein